MESRNFDLVIDDGLNSVCAKFHNPNVDMFDSVQKCWTKKLSDTGIPLNHQCY